MFLRIGKCYFLLYLNYNMKKYSIWIYKQYRYVTNIQTTKCSKYDVNFILNTITINSYRGKTLKYT